VGSTDRFPLRMATNTSSPRTIIDVKAIYMFAKSTGVARKRTESGSHSALS
jgi:hypothetical protein